MSATLRVIAVSWAVSVAACEPAKEQPAKVAIVPPVPVPTVAPKPPAPPSTLIVTVAGIGALRAGMTIREAVAALGESLTPRAGADVEACAYLNWQDAPAGVRVMVEQGRIARVDVDSASVATAEGARVGDSESRIDSLYAGRITKSPHKYTNGRYLTITPTARADSNYRIVFETKDGRVTTFRSGRRPPVEYVEGCG